MKELTELNIYIWGTGEEAKSLNRRYENQLKKINIAGYIDNDVAKQGGVFFEKKVLSPDVLVEDKEGYIIIANRYRNEILQQIEKEYPWYNNRTENVASFMEKVQIIERYKNSVDDEIKEVIGYLLTHPLQYFNYPFIEEYKNRLYDNIFFDEDKQLFYAMEQGKKMYFSRALKTKEQVKVYYSCLSAEQDMSSPHRYLTEEFDVPENAVVIDAGVAEGNFALYVIDRVKKIYLFEPDEDWLEALQYTFEPYKDKVEIVNKCVSDYLSDTVTTIDEVLQGTPVDFLKMDIEGEEVYALRGANKTLKASENMKCVICAYHLEHAYETISEILNEQGFFCQPSKGYMWFPEHQNSVRPSVLRRGLVKAEKRSRE